MQYSLSSLSCTDSKSELLRCWHLCSYGRTRHLPDFGLATTDFLLDDVVCRREDGSVPDTIADCRRSGWGDSDCTNDQVARVRCGEPGACVRLCACVCVCVDKRVVSKHPPASPRTKAAH